MVVRFMTRLLFSPFFEKRSGLTFWAILCNISSRFDRSARISDWK